MYGRYLMIVSAALVYAGAAAAEPAKPASTTAAQPANDRPAEVVLASADQTITTTPVAQAQSATPAKKPRAARVTTCRCAGQTPPTEQ